SGWAQSRRYSSSWNPRKARRTSSTFPRLLSASAGEPYLSVKRSGNLSDPSSSSPSATYCDKTNSRKSACLWSCREKQAESVHANLESAELREMNITYAKLRSIGGKGQVGR